MTRCDYCFDAPESCQREGRCASCAKRDACHRRISATIRVTRKCTRRCGHCCFSCSPECGEAMDIAAAGAIDAFLSRHDIRRLNVMGGEIWLNPDWRDLLAVLGKQGRVVRLVSNGDFLSRCPEFPEFAAELNRSGASFRLSVSNDGWHGRPDLDALDALADRLPDLPVNVDGLDGKGLSQAGIVPLGRALFDMSVYSMFSTYCSNPAHRYSLMIDELGDIFKCPFGIWKMGDVFMDDGEFRRRFRDVHGRFLKDAMSCGSCAKSHELRGRRLEFPLSETN